MFCRHLEALDIPLYPLPISFHRQQERLSITVVLHTASPMENHSNAGAVSSPDRSWSRVKSSITSALRAVFPRMSHREVIR